MIAAMSLRVGGWLLAVAIVSVWWFVSLAEPPIAREQADVVGDPSIDGVRSQSAFTERLKRGLANAPGAPSPRRNPFLFASREPAPPPVNNDVPPVEIPPVVAATAPAFVLAGIGTSDTPDGPVRTAVISGAKSVWLVKAGEELPNGYRVVIVGEDHVVLADTAGAETILRLK